MSRRIAQTVFVVERYGWFAVRSGLALTAGGGPSWGPFKIWYPPSAEYCPHTR